MIKRFFAYFDMPIINGTFNGWPLEVRVNLLWLILFCVAIKALVKILS